MAYDENEKIAKKILGLRPNEVGIDFAKFLDRVNVTDRDAVSVLYQLDASRRVTEAVDRFNQSSTNLGDSMLILTNRIYWLTLGIAILTVAMLILVVIQVSMARGESQPQRSLIPFETLRQWSMPPGGVGMEILVSEKATKEEVLALAQHLRSKHLSKGYIEIQIFDSREAYEHRSDLNYPEKEYYKHFLVDIGRNPKTGYDKVNWVAKGRDH